MDTHHQTAYKALQGTLTKTHISTRGKTGKSNQRAHTASIPPKTPTTVYIPMFIHTAAR